MGCQRLSVRRTEWVRSGSQVTRRGEKSNEDDSPTIEAHSEERVHGLAIVSYQVPKAGFDLRDNLSRSG